MSEFYPGQLVLDPDGYYAIVLYTTDSEVVLFTSNGLHVIAPACEVHALGLKPDGHPDPPASFAEIINGDARPGIEHHRTPRRNGG
jgi:hypothetical protein